MTRGRSFTRSPSCFSFRAIPLGLHENAKATWELCEGIRPGQRVISCRLLPVRFRLGVTNRPAIQLSRALDVSRRRSYTGVWRTAFMQFAGRNRAG